MTLTGEGPLYESPWGKLFPFQVDGIALSYERTNLYEGSGGSLVVWDTGLGKSHLAMALSAFLTEDDKIDYTILICEQNKMGEWLEDFQKATRLTSRISHGANRKKQHAKFGLPQVLITTYETAKADFTNLVKPPNARGVKIEPGWLIKDYEGKRVLVVYDEIAKLASRSSGNYKSIFWMLSRLRKTGSARAVGLSATPVDRDLETFFNLVRLLRPDRAMTVDEFEKMMVKYRDERGKPTFREERMADFRRDYVSTIMIRKRKTDPDVRDQFPRSVEETTRIDLAPDHAKVYQMIESLGRDLPDGQEPPPGLYTCLRQMASHPQAIIASQGTLARLLVEELGEEFLRSLPCTAEQAMIDWVKPIIEQEAKAVIFTFFGQSTLPLLNLALRRAGVKTYVNHGGLTRPQFEAARTGFKADEEPCVFLTSDAGKRGLNFPEATYLLHYELPLTHANYVQRSNRVHRISKDGGGALVTVQSFIVNDTVQEQIAAGVIKRNQWSDVLLGDDEAGETFFSAADRRAAFQITQNRRTRAAYH